MPQNKEWRKGKGGSHRSSSLMRVVLKLAGGAVDATSADSPVDLTPCSPEVSPSIAPWDLYNRLKNYSTFRAASRAVLAVEGGTPLRRPLRPQPCAIYALHTTSTLLPKFDSGVR